MSGCSDKYKKTYSVFEKDNVDVGGEDFISDRVMEVAFRILHFLHQPQHLFSLLFGATPTREKLSLINWLVSRGLPVTGSWGGGYSSSVKRANTERFGPTH